MAVRQQQYYSGRQGNAAADQGVVHNVYESFYDFFNGFFVSETAQAPSAQRYGGANLEAANYPSGGLGASAGQASWRGNNPKDALQRSPSEMANGPGAGGQSPQLQGPRSLGKYPVDKEDLIDQHVAYYLRHHPEVHSRHSLQRKRPGVYELDGREVAIEWQYSHEPGGQGHLAVIDGPLRQPFSDYMENTEMNAEYDTNTIEKRSALHMIPREKRMSFNDANKVYTRLEAMKVAKEQAVIREEHSGYVNDGKYFYPDDLMAKYNKTIRQKLGGGQQRQRPHPPGGPPAADQQQGAPPAPPVQGAPPAAPPAPPPAPAPAPAAEAQLPPPAPTGMNPPGPSILTPPNLFGTAQAPWPSLGAPGQAQQAGGWNFGGS